MKWTIRILVTLIVLILITIAVAGGLGGWFVYQRLPQREGALQIEQLSDSVQVRYDERGVPHIKAKNQLDLYRALGYVHAQDRLFQMEIMRRLAKGELAEILGPKLVETDTLFRTLGLRVSAQKMAAALDPQAASTQYLLAYLDGVNQYQDNRKLPIEYTALGINPQPFTPEDVFAISSYLAYSFAAALRTEPTLTYIRDKWGADHLAMFDEQWRPGGVLKDSGSTLSQTDWRGLSQLARISQSAMDIARLPMLEGSNAWAVSGKRTESGQALLAGDPHIAFSVPAVWYEAHLQAPDFELYGHFLALMPWALLGHNMEFGWSLTMFQNDDMDLVAEKFNPANPDQVQHGDQWVPLQHRSETIHVKNKADVVLDVRSSPNGPLISDALGDKVSPAPKTPIALWWTLQQTDNQSVQAFYMLNRANTLAKAREAASMMAAPGLNIVYANAKGDIGWWAAAKLPQRPAGVNPSFILDAAKGEADKPGFYAFNFNPQEENPERGYIVSANHQPANAVPVAGYYNEPYRARILDKALADTQRKWNLTNTQELQLLTFTNYPKEVLQHLLPLMKEAITDSGDKEFMEPLTKWDGDYTTDSVAPTLFTQLMYEIADGAFHDELEDNEFEGLLKLRNIDSAMLKLLSQPDSPWWDDVTTKNKETAQDIVRAAWSRTLAHLRELYGSKILDWTWGNTHTLTHGHPLGRQKPLNLLFDVGPLAVPGGREVPNNLAFSLGTAPWKVTYGPSTRRIIDFSDASRAVGINPVGQSGVWMDKHYNDQAAAYAAGTYVPMYLSEQDVRKHTTSTLQLSPR